MIDEAQRLPMPCLEYLQSLWDHPGTRITLVLCGAGTERALARLPQLASRIQTSAHGTLRTWAALTTHLQNTPLTTADTSVDRALLAQLCQQVAPPL